MGSTLQHNGSLPGQVLRELCALSHRLVAEKLPKYVQRELGMKERGLVMKYVTLGRTGLQVSQLSFGGIPIQRADAANTRALVDKLEEYGINYIDTARGYTVSEEYLGAALEGRRDKFILATKSMSRDRAGMARDIETSLSNLRTGYIDLYQIHNLPEKDIGKAFGPDGAYEALAEAKAAGRIGHIGVTAHSADALKILVEQYSDRLETVTFPYNIVEDQGKEALALAREKRMGSSVMKPLAGGNLDDYALALRYIAAAGVCDIMIPGMGSPDEVDRNAAVDLDPPLTAEELARCEAVRKELGTQFCRRCGYCAPCPNGIDIPQNFLLANYARKYGLAGWAQERYKAMPYHAGSCVMCGACEKRCPYNLPIRDMLEGVAKILGR